MGVDVPGGGVMRGEHKLVFVSEIPVRWGDMAALGHVNNATYFRYLEQVRIEWLASHGLVLQGAGQGPVIVNAACTYLVAIRYPARLHIQMFGGPPGNSSFDTFYEIREAADHDLLYSTGTSRVVWIDHDRGVSVRVPEQVRLLLPPAE